MARNNHLKISKKEENRFLLIVGSITGIGLLIYYFFKGGSIDLFGADKWILIILFLMVIIVIIKIITTIKIRKWLQKGISFSLIMGLLLLILSDFYDVWYNAYGFWRFVIIALAAMTTIFYIYVKGLYSSM